jgi:hypothetical protein
LRAHEQLADQDTWRFTILGELAAVMPIVAPKGCGGRIFGRAG